MRRAEDLFPHHCSNSDCWKPCRRVPGLRVCEACERLIPTDIKKTIAQNNPKYRLWLACNDHSTLTGSSITWIDMQSTEHLHSRPALWAKIINLCLKHEQMTVRELVEELGISDYVMRYQVLPRMVEKGCLRRKGTHLYEAIPDDERSADAIRDEQLQKAYLKGFKRVNPSILKAS